ncbi:MAG: cation transporter [Planctomycetes bacterium]|nr:cation transporter [Planctomycetota bacterium]
MMVVELAVGYASGSMALVADGWHMATHAGALGLSALAYWFARTRMRHGAFTFGTGKVYALAGYTSAVLLAGVAAWLGVESTMRLAHPGAIRFAEALPIAVVGLVVNVVCALLLSDGHGHDHGGADAHGRRDPADRGHEHARASGHAHGGAHAHDDSRAHEHGHDHDHPHDHAHDHPHEHGHAHGAPPVEGNAGPAGRAPAAHDHNLRSAHLHVLADAFTSVLAILALLGAEHLGWTFLDPAMGLVGAVVILRWSVGLCLGAARVLLDVRPSEALEASARATLEAIDDVAVADLHVWELGPGRRAVLASIVTERPRDVGHYREALFARLDVSHVTVEVHRRPGDADRSPAARSPGSG